MGSGRGIVSADDADETMSVMMTMDSFFINPPVHCRYTELRGILKKNKKLFVYNFKEYAGGEDLDGRI